MFGNARSGDGRMADQQVGFLFRTFGAPADQVLAGLADLVAQGFENLRTINSLTADIGTSLLRR